jgi:hypothetical protein
LYALKLTVCKYSFGSAWYVISKCEIRQTVVLYFGAGFEMIKHFFEKITTAIRHTLHCKDNLTRQDSEKDGAAWNVWLNNKNSNNTWEVSGGYMVVWVSRLPNQWESSVLGLLATAWPRKFSLTQFLLFHAILKPLVHTSYVITNQVYSISTVLWHKIMPTESLVACSVGHLYKM